MGSGDMTTRGDGAARASISWRKVTKKGVNGVYAKKGVKGVYELADGTARIVKMLDNEQYLWWVWSINPTSDIEKFKMLREAKKHIETMRAEAAKANRHVLLNGSYDDALRLAELVLEWANTPGPHFGNPYNLKFVQTAERVIAGETT